MGCSGQAAGQPDSLLVWAPSSVGAVSGFEGSPSTAGSASSHWCWPASSDGWRRLRCCPRRLRPRQRVDSFGCRRSDIAGQPHPGPSGPVAADPLAAPEPRRSSAEMTGPTRSGLAGSCGSICFATAAVTGSIVSTYCLSKRRVAESDPSAASRCSFASHLAAACRPAARQLSPTCRAPGPSFCLGCMLATF